LGSRFSQTRIVNSDTCQFKEMVYLNLVDAVTNEGNELVVDRSVCGAGKKTYACPISVAQAVVGILR